MAFLGQEEQIRELQERFQYISGVIFFAFSVLLGRLVFLQLIQGDRMRLFSEENRIKRVKVKAPRGMIFDRYHQLLIDNQPAFDLEIIPQYLQESGQKSQTIAQLAKILKISTTNIENLLQKAKNQPSFLPIKIKTDLSRDEVAIIEMRKIDMPGVEIREEIKRTNLYSEVAAHLLGYIGEVNTSELPIVNKSGLKYRLGDSIGRFGLEQRMENVLRGTDGQEIREVDALGRVKLDQGKNRFFSAPIRMSAEPGNNLILTIDQDLQLIATQTFGDISGAVVALDPNNGQILAMVSRPSFNPTTFSRGISPTLWNQLINNKDRPLRDKTIQDHYPPGSSFKVITAIAGLEEGAIDENTTFNCPGKIRIGNRIYHCHSRHGDVNVVTALMRSCNVFFYRTALKLKSVDDIASWAFKLGLGKKTGINLAAETAGSIPTEAWKLKRFNQIWNIGETAAVAVGQSFVTTTALQMANVYAAIATGGLLYRPYVVQSIESYEGKKIKDFQPELLTKVAFQPKTLRLIYEGLYGVVNRPGGTAYSQRLPGIDFVGKTGTAQVIRLSADKVMQKCELKKKKDRHNAVFVGFAPLEKPSIVVAVIGEHACHGSSGAAPTARAIIKKYLEKTQPDLYSEKAIAKRLKINVKTLFKDGQNEETEQVDSEDEDWVPPEEVEETSEMPNITTQ